MNKNSRYLHWENVYQTQDENKLSWYQDSPDSSVKLIESIEIQNDWNVIDVGGGTSSLIDYFIKRDIFNITILDISKSAIEKTKNRVANNNCNINWIVDDIINYKFNTKFKLWHDRATYHFLTNETDRINYKKNLNSSLEKGGYFIISTFHTTGPDKCSNLSIQKYSKESLNNEFSDNFDLIESFTYNHKTPSKNQQVFLYCLFKKTV